MSENKLQGTPTICKDLQKIYQPNSKHILQEFGRTLSRTEEQERTGHGLAVKNVSFEVQMGK
mgnify:FL=1